MIYNQPIITSRVWIEIKLTFPPSRFFFRKLPFPHLVGMSRVASSMEELYFNFLIAKQFHGRKLLKSFPVEIISTLVLLKLQ